MFAYFYWPLCHCHPKANPLKNTLSIALDSEVKNLDPRKATDANSMRIAGSYLFWSRQNRAGHYKFFQMALKDGSKRVWIIFFYLKPLKFSNGRKVTKEDISFSFQEFTKKESSFLFSFQKYKICQSFRTKKKTLHCESCNETIFTATFLSSDLPVIKILPKKGNSKNLKKYF